MCVGSLILVPTYVVQYLLSLGLLNQLLTDCKMEETGPSGIQDRRGKKGCKRRLPVDEEEEELVLEGDKKDEMVLEGDEEDELVLEGDKEKERDDLRNEKDEKKEKKWHRVREIIANATTLRIVSNVQEVACFGPVRTVRFSYPYVATYYTHTPHIVGCGCTCLCMKLKLLKPVASL